MASRNQSPRGVLGACLHTFTPAQAYTAIYHIRSHLHTELFESIRACVTNVHASQPCMSTHKLARGRCGGFGIRNFLTLFLSIEVNNCNHAASVCSKGCFWGLRILFGSIPTHMHTTTTMRIDTHISADTHSPTEFGFCKPVLSMCACLHMLTLEISKALRLYQSALKDSDQALARHVRA